MCELAVTAADYFDSLDDLIGILLKLSLNLFGDREHGSRTERVTCMNTDGIDILDKADSDLVVLGVSYDLELKLFPTGDGFLNENLVNKACL